MAKLTDKQINEIKNRYEKWKKIKKIYDEQEKDSPYSLAKEFKIFPSRIYRICNEEYYEKMKKSSRDYYYKNRERMKNLSRNYYWNNKKESK